MISKVKFCKKMNYFCSFETDANRRFPIRLKVAAYPDIVQYLLRKQNLLYTADFLYGMYSAV